MPTVWQCTGAVPSMHVIIYERYANVTPMYIKIVPRTQMFLQTFLQIENNIAVFGTYMS